MPLVSAYLSIYLFDFESNDMRRVVVVGWLLQDSTPGPGASPDQISTGAIVAARVVRIAAVRPSSFVVASEWSESALVSIVSIVP